MAILESNLSAQGITNVLSKEAIARLKLVAAVAAKRSSRPILECVSLTFEDGKLYAEATDITCYVRMCIMDCSDWAPNTRVILPARQLKALKAGSTLTIFPSASTTAFARYSIGGMSGISLDSLSFPVLPSVQSGEWVDASPTYFEHLAAVATHASDSESRPILMGVHHENNVLVATDGMRLMRVELSESFPTPFNMTGEYAATLYKIFGSHGATIQTEGVFTKICGLHATAYIRHIDGTYPATDRIIPTNFNHVGRLQDSGLWISVLKDGIAAVGKKASARISFESDRVTVSMQGEDMATRYEMELADVGIKDMTIEINPGNLLDALKQTGDCEIKMVDHRAPIVLDGLNGRRALLALIGR